MSSDGEPELVDDIELDKLLDRLGTYRERLAMEKNSRESESYAKEFDELCRENAAMYLNEVEATSYENEELLAWQNEHRLMRRSAAESESWEDTLSGYEQKQLVWENYWFNHEEQLARRNCVADALLARIRWAIDCAPWEHSAMLRVDAEAESWRVHMTKLRAENDAYHMAMDESYQAVFGDAGSDAEEVASPILAPTSKFPSPVVPRQPLHPPPPAPPKHGMPGGPNVMFIPAPGDSAGQALRYQKDKHNERERNRKARRAMEKVSATTLSKAGMSSSSSTTWTRPLLNPPPPPPAKRSA
jgi:hypothetical protein